MTHEEGCGDMVDRNEGSQCVVDNTYAQTLQQIELDANEHPVQVLFRKHESKECRPETKEIKVIFCHLVPTRDFLSGILRRSMK